MKNILESLVEIIIIIISTHIARYIRTKLEDIKYDNIIKLVKIAVMAAEKEFSLEPKSGERKKEYVTEFIRNKVGNKINGEELSLLIEFSVLELDLEKQKKGSVDEIQVIHG